MNEHDMRNMLLSELIDKMHSRMADKMFPPMSEEMEKAAVEDKPINESQTGESVMPPMGAEDNNEEDEELEKELMRQNGV